MRKRSFLITMCALTVLIGVATIFYMRARTRAHSRMCAARLFPMQFIAMRRAADTQSDRYPSDLTYLSNHLAAKWMVCPADSLRQPARDWSLFTPEHSSYELVTPALVRTDTNSVFLRCRIHGHTAYSDQTVFDGTRRRHKFD